MARTVASARVLPDTLWTSRKWLAPQGEGAIEGAQVLCMREARKLTPARTAGHRHYDQAVHVTHISVVCVLNGSNARNPHASLGFSCPSGKCAYLSRQTDNKVSVDA